MNPFGKLLLCTSDLAEAVHAVSSIYCPHEVHVRGGSLGIGSELEVRRTDAMPVVGLKYSAPVRIDADFDGLMLMMSCADGAAEASQGHAQTGWSRGHTVPFSPGIAAQLHFNGSFAQRSVKVAIDRLEELCARRLNHPVEYPLRFALRPFSAQLETAWQMAVNMALSYESEGIALPTPAVRALDEFMLSLLLDLHPHNYSEELCGRHPLSTPKAIREAQRLMSEPKYSTVSQIAAAVGVSVRSLEAGFREWKQDTPGQYMRRVRLEAARKALMDPGEHTTVTDVALNLGFVHLPRFSQYYKAAFNEHPSQTLQRARLR
jgi:AraC-like DNA-binding protein